jgi:phage repressor protein C with HTH and peptisase S24 domain
MLSIIKVQGDSMMPELADGDFVMISRLFWTLKPQDKVVVDHSIYHQVIKQIKVYQPEKGLLLEGLNDASVSTEKLGWVQPKQVIGKVILSFRR